MRRTLIVFLIALIGLSSYSSLAAQSRQRGRYRGPMIRHLKERHDLRDMGVDYSKVARFKIVSRKTTYRVGELASIDIAILNVSDKPIYFYELEYPILRLSGSDKDAKQELIHELFSELIGIVPESFRRIEPGRILNRSFYLIIGCDDDSKKEFFKARNNLNQTLNDLDAYYRGFFDQELFVNWGDACLEAKKPGTYTITAEHRNDDMVIVAPRGPKVKTAVGHMNSNALTLTIIE